MIKATLFSLSQSPVMVDENRTHLRHWVQKTLESTDGSLLAGVGSKWEKTLSQASDLPIHRVDRFHAVDWGEGNESHDFPGALDIRRDRTYIALTDDARDLMDAIYAPKIEDERRRAAELREQLDTSREDYRDLLLKVVEFESLAWWKRAWRSTFSATQFSRK